ncbi:DUF58 domain-containing protein [Rudaeicoccus suwonensis]|uniref:DUF58 domain-containing protein n=1 Tax=Rudaeicoccus suwonensis TaxID=657409 RepID=UPI001477078B|nr:DUF58 domain-containing protein [Rudaeicoccus suwonensis]
MTLIISGLVLGYEDITRVGVLLVSLTILTWAISRRSQPRVTVRRTTTPTTLVPDQRAEVLLSITNLDRRACPLYLAEEQLDYSLGDRPRFVLPRLGTTETRQVTYVAGSDRRGHHRLGPLALQHRDPFGLTSSTRVIDSTDEILVLPRVIPLGSSHPPGAGYGSEGETPQMVALHGEEDVSIRGYRDGDDLRKVHWPATAHRGELMVRQEDRPARRSATVLLDSRAAGHTGTGAHSSFEWAVSAVASIVVRLDELDYQTHLLTRETRTDGFFDDHAAATTEDMVRALADAGFGDEQEFELLASDTRDLTTSGGIVVAVVTDLDDGRADELAALRQPGSAALGFVLDTTTFAHPGAEPGQDAVRLRNNLAGAGWRIVVVDAGMPIERAWAIVTNKALVQVGAL